MTDFRLISNDDDEVARGLRSLYAAPAGDGYWNELEARIMARVADVELGWWTELDRWVRPALAAAAVLLMAAGVAMFRAHEVEGDTASRGAAHDPDPQSRGVPVRVHRAVSPSPWLPPPHREGQGSLVSLPR